VPSLSKKPVCGGTPEFRSVIDPRLRFDLLAVGVFDLTHLADRFGQLDDSRVSIATGKDQVQQGRLAPQQFQDLLEVDQLELEGVVDLVEDQQVVVPRGDFLPGEVDGVLGVGPVLFPGVGIALDAAKPLAGGDQVDGAVELLDPVSPSGVKIPLHELDDPDLHAVTAGEQRHPQRRGGLAFAVAGDDHDQPLPLLRLEALDLVGVGSACFHGTPVMAITYRNGIFRHEFTRMDTRPCKKGLWYMRTPGSGIRTCWLCR